MKSLNIFLLLLISINIARADEGIIKTPLEYDVEIIIFEDANARYINSEYWNQDALRTTTETEAIESSKAPNTISVSKITTDLYKNIKPSMLNQEYKRMHNARDYNVLFYVSWRQTGLNKNKAFKIDINALENNHKKASENKLSGDFKLVLARFLHFYADLEYQRNSATITTDNIALNNEETENSSIETNTYPLKIHRRMRSKELHYIDHPLVGVLIQINPVKKTKTVESTGKPRKIS